MDVPHTLDVTQEEPLETPEIRVWVHPPEGGDDRYFTFPSFESAEAFIKQTDGAEDVPLIAFKGYELNLYAIEK